MYHCEGPRLALATKVETYIITGSRKPRGLARTQQMLGNSITVLVEPGQPLVARAHAPVCLSLATPLQETIHINLCCMQWKLPMNTLLGWKHLQCQPRGVISTKEGARPIQCQWNTHGQKLPYAFHCVAKPRFNFPCPTCLNLFPKHCIVPGDIINL